ncbi:energy-coupling factor ABC transporter ATP-binding protein [Thermosynechococcus vestitus]|uniref:ABC transporter ATP-binding protein n=1 Tax=Thermosynechococcus vestitus (strain NIES-2133 / IAM M-273 / BP-1) TaxID=197221 RepID=Q8DJC9_THEVB|nr:ABC transporter ATP-binding protein [Thermosynechococcus vestitus]BAC08850.1 ABC transporter ATP-binding protein [Thermosynechococcus vestitus BP-1]BAY51157.1 ABC transporter ATP-binding protein [Thermostichus vulcanus NIES-2134]
MTALLEIRDLHFGYGRTPSLLRGINLRVTGGDRLGIIGDNGSGKTTLLLLCAAVLKPQRGTITCLGQSVVAGQFQPAVGVVLQHPADQLIGTTVAEDVAFGPENLGCSALEVQQRVHQALAMTGTLHLANRLPHQLSGGEQRMVAIAGILAMQPKLILYDEPTAFLDQRSCRTLMEFLQTNATPGLVVSHDLAFLRAVCTQIFLLESGHLCPLGL